MLAIVAAILFAIALIIDIADADIGLAAGTFVTAGLLCLALHMTGIGASTRLGRGWRVRR